VALKLKRQGITRVRPLHGGIALWMDRAFPTSVVKLDSDHGADGLAAARPVEPREECSPGAS